MFDTSILEESLKTQRERMLQEQSDLLEQVRRVLLGIRKKHGIRAAYVVGSLGRPGAWGRSSDVDVAVSGCSRDVLEVMRALEEATGRDVDVIDLERHPAADSFVRAGLKVYG